MTHRGLGLLLGFVLALPSAAGQAQTALTPVDTQVVAGAGEWTVTALAQKGTGAFAACIALKLLNDGRYSFTLSRDGRFAMSITRPGWRLAGLPAVTASIDGKARQLSVTGPEDGRLTIDLRDQEALVADLRKGRVLQIATTPAVQVSLSGTARAIDALKDCVAKERIEAKGAAGKSTARGIAEEKVHARDWFRQKIAPAMSTLQLSLLGDAEAAAMDQFTSGEIVQAWRLRDDVPGMLRVFDAQKYSLERLEAMMRQVGPSACKEQYVPQAPSLTGGRIKMITGRCGQKQELHLLFMSTAGHAYWIMHLDVPPGQETRIGAAYMAAVEKNWP